jgi:CCR4-NOT transcription complex subunit 6
LIAVGNPPPVRRWINYHIDRSIAISDEKFSVFCYNILSEQLATPEQHFYCPSWALDWSYRRKKILSEIESYNCDIVCLQEVEAGQYSEYFQPKLALKGYAGIYQPKSRARTMENWKNVDGCAIFYKKDK